MGGMLSVGIFLRDPSRIYSSFGENHGKFWKTRSIRATEDLTCHLPSTNLLPQNRSASGGARTDNLTFMPYPVFKPETFGIAAGSPNQYTVWLVRSINRTDVSRSLNFDEDFPPSLLLEDCFLNLFFASYFYWCGMIFWLLTFLTWRIFHFWTVFL